MQKCFQKYIAGNTKRYKVFHTWYSFIQINLYLAILYEYDNDMAECFVLTFFEKSLPKMAIKMIYYKKHVSNLDLKTLKLLSYEPYI